MVELPVGSFQAFFFFFLVAGFLQTHSPPRHGWVESSSYSGLRLGKEEQQATTSVFIFSLLWLLRTRVVH